jgi:hypothetical protein
VSLAHQKQGNSGQDTKGVLMAEQIKTKALYKITTWEKISTDY